MTTSRENIESLRTSITAMEVRKEQHRKEGRADMVIAMDKVISVIQDDIEEQEKDLATNRDGATD
jgi:hypothetical protein